jgi:hypothetical protein
MSASLHSNLMLSSISNTAQSNSSESQPRAFSVIGMCVGAALLKIVGVSGQVLDVRAKDPALPHAS